MYFLYSLFDLSVVMTVPSFKRHCQQSPPFKFMSFVPRDSIRSSILSVLQPNNKNIPQNNYNNNNNSNNNNNNNF